MRSALFIRPLLLLITAAAALGQPPAQKLNPHTQIRWPVNCTDSSKVYNYLTNQCVSAATLDSSGNLNNPVPPGKVTWPTSCATGVYVPATNTCVPPGTAANPAGVSGEGQINMGGIFSSIPGSAPYATNGMMYKGGVVAGTSPAADIRAYGAVIDGTFTAVDNALLSAVGVCNITNAYSNSCQVLLPCVGANTGSGCSINNGSLLPPNTSGKTIELDLQGVWNLKSTLVLPIYYTVVGKGGGSTGSFQSVGATARIVGPAMKGTVGTAIPGAQTGSITSGTTSLTLSSVTNHTVGETVQAASTGSGTVSYIGTVTGITGNVLTVSPAASSTITNQLITVISKFTPTYTTGTSDNFHVKSAIGVGGYQTCTNVSASRDGSIAANAPNTTFVAGASISQVSITSNVLTVIAPNTFTVGQSVGLIGFKASALTFLNEQTVTIVTASASQFTAAFTHANLALTPDTGVNAAPVATTCVSSNGVPENIRIPVAQTITVTNCADSTFNVVQANVNGQDWPNSSIQTYEGSSVGLTKLSVHNNVLTVTANNTFTPGQRVTIFRRGTAPLLNDLLDDFLNEHTFTIATASPTQFTIPFVHADVTVVDTGDAVVSLATATTTGCTVVGIDDYNFEVVRIDGIDTTPITQIGIASNVLTVTANNNFTVGESVNFTNVGINTYLNNQTVTTISVSPTQFTAAFTHADVTLGTDTGMVGRNNALATGATLSATFAHTHAPTDLWGMVAVSSSDPQPGPRAHLDLQSVSITNAYGPQLWMNNTSTINLTGVATTPVSYPTSAGIECDGCWWGQLNSVQAMASPVGIHCITNCGTPGYSYGFRCSQDSTRRNFYGCGNMAIRDLTVLGGLKVDGNGMDNAAGSGPQIGPISNLIVERSAYGGIVFDTGRALANSSVTVDNMVLSDNYAQVYTQNLVATDCCYTTGFADLGNAAPFIGASLTNAYWMNGVRANGLGGQNITTNMAATAPHTSTGILSDNSVLNANVRGSGANFSPALIPVATLPVLNVSCSTCIPVTGPDGVAGSAVEIQTSAGPTNVTPNGASINTMVTYTGDMMAFGTWLAPGALQTGKTPGSAFGRNSYYQLVTSGADLFQGGIGTNYSPQVPTNFIYGGGLFSLVNDSWQPGIQVVTFTKGDSNPHNMRLALMSGSTLQGVGSGNKFWGWWWALIPGPNNPAYNPNITRAEVMRWVQDLVHGYVPGNLPSGGGILAMNPAHKLYWGSDTDLYRDSAGALKTDGSFNAVGGLSINGVPVSGATLTEWVSSGIKTAGAAISANGTQLWSFQLPGALTSTKVTFIPSTADNSANLYDIGIYSGSGTLLCHTGATPGTTFAPNTTNAVNLPWLASCPLAGGTRYLLALTAVVGTAILNTGGTTWQAIGRANPTSGSTTTGGVLNNSITPPADSWTQSGFPQIALHN